MKDETKTAGQFSKNVVTFMDSQLAVLFYQNLFASSTFSAQCGHMLLWGLALVSSKSNLDMASKINYKQININGLNDIKRKISPWRSMKYI